MNIHSFCSFDMNMQSKVILCLQNVFSLLIWLLSDYKAFEKVRRLKSSLFLSWVVIGYFLLQQNSSSLKVKPKITITRVPTVDQTENGFLYPLDTITNNDQSSPPSSPDHHSCVTAPTLPDRKFTSDTIEENDVPMVFHLFLGFDRRTFELQK